MKREDFKQITKEQIDVVKSLLKLGYCTDEICLGLNGNCPFDAYNSTNGCSCFESGYADSIPTLETDMKLIESCKQFLSMCKDDEKTSLLNEENIKFLLERFDFSKNNLMCVEELSELQQAISKVLRKKEGAKDNLIEEMADVLIVVKMLQILHGVSDTELSNEIERKMKRNLDRARNNKE